MPSSSTIETSEHYFARRYAIIGFAIIGFVLVLAIARPAPASAGTAERSPIRTPVQLIGSILITPQTSTGDSSVEGNNDSPVADAAEQRDEMLSGSAESSPATTLSFLANIANLLSGTAWAIAGGLLALLLLIILLLSRPKRPRDPPRKATSHFQKTERFSDAKRSNEIAIDTAIDPSADSSLLPSSESAAWMEHRISNPDPDEESEIEESSLNLFTDFEVDSAIGHLDDSSSWLPPRLSDSDLPSEMDFSNSGESFVTTGGRHAEIFQEEADSPLVAAAPRQLISSAVVDRNCASAESLNDEEDWETNVQELHERAVQPVDASEQIRAVIAEIALDLGLAPEEFGEPVNASTQLAELKNKIRSLKNVNHKLQSEVDAFQERLSALNDTLQGMELETSNLRDEDSRQSESLRQLQIDHDATVEQRDELHALLNDSKIANSVLDSQVATLNSCISEAGAPDLDRMISEFREQLSDATGKRHQADKMLTQAEEQRTEVAIELRRLRKDFSELQDEKVQQDSVAAQHGSEREEWTLRERELTKIADELRNSLDAKSSRIDELAGDMKTLELASKEIARQCELDQSVLADAESQIAEMKTSQQALEIANADLLARIDNLSRKSGDFPYAKLEQTLATVAAQNEILVKSQEDLHDLRLKFEDRAERELDLRERHNIQMSNAQTAAGDQSLQQFGSLLESHQKAHQATQAELEQLRTAQMEILTAVQLIQSNRRSSSAPQLPEGHDRLSEINGIGAKFEQNLFDAGVVTFSAIALWSEKEMSRNAKLLRCSVARIRNEKWVEQAQAKVAQS